MVALTIVIGDSQWGQPCLAYNVEARFTNAGLRSLVAAQAELNQVFVDNANLCPPSALHTSIYALAPVSWNDASKEDHWQRIRSDSVSIVKEECAERAPFALRFSQWRVTKQAIIVLADDSSGVISLLRNRLALVSKHETLSAPTYEFIHCTLARFKRAVELPSDAVESLVRAPLALQVEVDRIRIVRERVYPSLDVDVVFSAELV
jgi:hypothetical protein